MDLEKEFDLAMINIYRRALAEARYKAKIFLAMVGELGGVATAKELVNRDRPTDGYRALWERNCLHLTVEAVVFDDARWHSLFSACELDRIRVRLRQYGYPPALAA